MNKIGGFLGIQFGKGEGIYHENALRLNCGRAALQLFLENHNYSKIIVPHFICKDILEPIRRSGIEYELYCLDENMMPRIEKVKRGEILLYVNYFGVCDKLVESVVLKYKEVIIDCSQAFFFKPTEKIPAIYSPRKFYGLPDGGFLYSPKKIEFPLKQSNSQHRFIHLLKKTEDSIDNGYEDFKMNELLFENYEIERMSFLTESLLKAQNHSDVIKSRVTNFNYYHEKLEKLNEFSIILNTTNGICPLSYPFYSTRANQIVNQLIENGVFTPNYWPNENRLNHECFGNRLSEFLIHLPINQELNNKNINYVINKITKLS